jgi:hypothetical protein
VAATAIYVNRARLKMTGYGREELCAKTPRILQGNHTDRAAGGVVDGLDDVAAGAVFLRREDEIDHELDHLARGEVLPGAIQRERASGDVGRGGTQA